MYVEICFYPFSECVVIKGFLIAGLSSCVGVAHAIDLTGTVYDAAGKETNIDPKLLFAISLVESATEAGNNKISPYPWTLRSDKPFYGRTRKDAEKELARLLAQGVAVDVGLMQINTRWHGHRVKQPSDLLDPLTNVRIGAQILNERLKASPEDAVKAVATYHSFDEERGRWYAGKVFRVWTWLNENER